KGNVRPLTGMKWTNDSYSGRPALTLTACGGFEALWDPAVVLLHRTPGTLEEVVVDPDDDFEDVIWDGQRLCVGTLRHGLKFIDPKTRASDTIDRDKGLPPSDEGMRLYPVQPGKILAVGSFGPNCRAWCAVVE